MSFLFLLFFSHERVELQVVHAAVAWFSVSILVMMFLSVASQMPLGARGFLGIRSLLLCCICL